MSSYSSEQTRKYEVVWTPDGWAVARGGELLERFAAQETAIDHACRAAREDARSGWLGIVTTRTTPQEFHCYTPLEGPQAKALQAIAGPFPRLVSSR
jgi:hypothetical protein